MKIIDIHTHGMNGYDTHAESASDILRLAENYGKAGISEIILSVYPSQINKMRQEMKVIRDAIEIQDKELNYSSQTSEKHFIDKAPLPAKILGVHLEGPFLNKSMCGALDKSNFLEPDEYAFEYLIDGFEDIVKIITIAPELDGADSLIKKISNKGIIVSMGHSEATFNEAERGFNSGAKGITHIFNAMRGIHHREPGITGFALINYNIYIEVIADHYHLHPAVLKLIFALKNPERIIIISDSVKETKLTDLNPPLKDTSGKLKGGTMSITQSTDWLIQNGYNKELILNCITKNPYRYLIS